MGIFLYDIETLATDSNAVVLSAAIVHVDARQKPTYQELLGDVVFVKFDAEEQIRKYKRSMSTSTMNWWKTQSDETKQISLIPSDKDVSLIEGCQILSNYYKSFGQSYMMWCRGMDGMITENLFNSAGMRPIARYNHWRDIRTAIDILYGTTNGYCAVDCDGFDKSIVTKHHPVHDVCYDAMMLLYGVEQ